MTEKIALFDFCETLANFQTADRFVDYVRENDRRRSILFLKMIHSVLRRTRIIAALSLLFPHKSINKRIYALQLRGLRYEEIDHYARLYYNTVIHPNLIPRMLEELQRQQIDGYRIVLVSGGYDFYLKYFAAEFRIETNDIICTSFVFKNGKCTGLFQGQDCLFDEKVKRINRLLKDHQESSIAYSDSKSDLPMLEWAKTAIVVREISGKKWNNKYNEIVWER